ncbi:N-acetylglucosaminyl-phosphatidylinositol de-N-acetylase [Balamuthia mandrillaris]
MEDRERALLAELQQGVEELLVGRRLHWEELAAEEEYQHGQDWEEWVQTALSWTKTALLLLNLLVAFALAFWFRRPATSPSSSPQTEGTNRTRRVALVIAHPDDEAMFFVPTVLSLQQMKRELYVLCLSNGDYGKSSGKQRTKELIASCRSLGIAADRVVVEDHERLKDGPENEWDTKLIAKIVSQFVSAHRIDSVITFDEFGVSSHPNHIAVYNGVRDILSSGAQCQVFKLTTTSLLRKYTGLVDVLYSGIVESVQQRNAIHFYSSTSFFLPTHRAMICHNSQYVWFRRLFVLFSRYSYVNTLLPVERAKHRN